jgi:hypothetical protein
VKVERHLVLGCKTCGKKMIYFKLDRPLDLSLLEVLKSNGFTEAPNFTKSGLVYATNHTLIVSGPLGGDKLNVKCKKDDCDAFLNDIEELLTKME